MERFYLKVSAQFASVTLATSSTDAVSTALAVFRGKVRLVASVDSWVAIGTYPNGGVEAAKGTGVFMPAGHVEYFHANGGDIISAVTDSAASGSLNISVME